MSAVMPVRPGAAIDAAEVSGFLADYCDCIADERFEEWVGFFTDDARYRVTTEENRRKGYPIGLIDCIGKGMMQDRIFGLRSANVYEPHRYRHVLSVPRILGPEAGGVRVKTSFLAARTTAGGRSELFVSGVYDDLVVREEGLRLKSRLVVCDASLIDLLIVIPL